MTVDALRHGPVADAIRRHRLVVVLRRVEPQAALLDLAGELADAGARIFEITFDAPSADADLIAVRERLAARPDGPFVLGAGTIIRRGQLEAARRAGAEFAVAPLLDPDLVSTAVAEDVPFIPGALTPTEVARAWTAGATFVKLFPASAVGPTFVRELRGPMPDVSLIPTGGIDASTARSFLDAGAAAGGIGSAFTKADPATRRAIVGAIARLDDAALDDAGVRPVVPEGAG
jgi:2-dehydro-3-deoxyphosphogluconate aldolase/(4S)-4-hydroxy-2-oxoglutarate aldolase